MYERGTKEIGLMINSLPLVYFHHEVLLNGKPALSRPIRFSRVDHFQIIVVYKDWDELVHFLRIDQNQKMYDQL